MNAQLGFGQAPAGTCASDPDDLPGTPEGLEGIFSVDGTGAGQGKCLQAKVAFLTATVRDKASGDTCTDNRAGLADGEDPTTLCLTAFLDVTSSGTNPRITLANLGQADLTLGFTGDANVDIRFRTGVGSGPDFPSVVGKFHLYWGFSGSTEQAPSDTSLLITFDGLHLDAGAFIGRFLGPMVKGIQNVTKPLQPVIETLQAEVPIVSDLSKLVGEGPVTMLDLLEAVSGNDLSLVRSVLQLVRFVNALPSDSAGLLIPLGNSPGSFTVDNTRAQGPQPTPDQAGKGIKNADAGTNLTNQLSSLGADTPADECEGRGSTFGVWGTTFPFLADATQIFGVLMGEDVTLIRYDAGTLKAGAGFGYCCSAAPDRARAGRNLHRRLLRGVRPLRDGLRHERDPEAARGWLRDGAPRRHLHRRLQRRRRRGARDHVHRHGLRRGRGQRRDHLGRHPRRDHLHDEPRPRRPAQPGREAQDRGDHQQDVQPDLPVRRLGRDRRVDSLRSSRSTCSSSPNASRSRSSV